MNYETMREELAFMPLEKQIEVITQLSQGDDYRLFCRAYCSVIMHYSSKRHVNFAAIDQILLAAIKFEKASHKVGILRGAFAYRRYLEHWHNLRDNAHVRAHATEPERARRLLVGLYDEVRNSVSGLWWMLTPHRNYIHGYAQDHFWPR